MATTSENIVSKILVPQADATSFSTQSTNALQLTAARPIDKIFLPPFRNWAPAWFYSALSWLGQSYSDASNTEHAFGSYLVGCNVDPYQALGATRLFVIQYLRNEFFLALAPDVDSDAIARTDTFYPKTDAGILQLYQDLAASDIFSSVTHCYVPGRVDLVPSLQQQLSNSSSLTGYDPATGLRRILMGSAISQVVPLTDFGQVANEQIYDDSPAIVPIATSLVYDVTTNNAIGDTTFVLPVAYIVDQPTPGQYYVSRFGSTATSANAASLANGVPLANAFDYGQTAIFENGPGYDASKATQLGYVSSTELVSPAGGTDFVTTTFQSSVAHSIIAVGNAVVTGVSALTYSSRAPLSVFENQRIVGFYRESGWNNSLGYPIFDYQAANASFAIAQTASEIAPVTVYDPTKPFLNGGTLPNVLAKFAKATYIFTPDVLSSMIEDAGAYAVASAPAGLSVMSASLDIMMSSNPSAGLMSQLTVPAAVTVTTTHAEIVVPSQPTPVTRLPLPVTHLPTPIVATSAAAVSATADATEPAATATNPGMAPTTSTTATNVTEARRASGIISHYNGNQTLVPIGQSGNTPSTTAPSPSQVKAQIDAFIPVEALLGTGIINIPIGTSFPTQSLGDGSLFKSNGPGTLLNLSDAHRDTPPLPTIELQLANTSLTLAAGIQYVFSLQGAELSVRGSDGTTQSATPALGQDPDAAHVYVGAILFEAGLGNITLYPVLSLALNAPAVGSSGVAQGETYSVCLTYGPQECSLDILDSDQIVIAPALTVPSPQPADNSKPQAGDLYFGSFVGGSAQMTVWAVPVFLPIAAAALPSGTSYNGTMSLVAATTGVPAYSLQITDSSLFIFTNINVDSETIGSVSNSSVFVAGVAINSAPDDLSSKAFAPTTFVLGIVRKAQVGTMLRYVFIPEDDSVSIGGKRYMLSAIQLADLTDDPRQRPYPPNYWPDWGLWQFANRHNPYVDIRYEGAQEADRIAQAQADTAAIAAHMRQVQEPLQMYLDTSGMTVWPILAFPNADAATTATVDQSQLQGLASGIVQLLQTKLPTALQPGVGASASEQIVLPTGVGLNNPYTYGVDFSLVSTGATQASTSVVSSPVAMSSVDAIGLQVTNLSPGVIGGAPAGSLQAQFSLQQQQNQEAQADLAEAKANGPQFMFAADTTTVTDSLVTQESTFAVLKPPLLIYGFSVYNPSTGEGYLIELVPTDLTVPNHLPDATENATYDPYYVRVVFLQRRRAYNMSIIVPSIAYDQYGHLAVPETTYSNLVSKTDDFAIGYMSSRNDSTGFFDNVNFEFPSVEAERQAGSGRIYVYTNLLYASPPIGQLAIALVRDTIFACRRKNWDATCKLMVATNPENTALYLAFGGGDLVPMRLDAGVTVENSIPAHMYNLTTTFSNVNYVTAKTVDIANVPYVVSVGAVPGQPAPVFSNFSLDATAGTADIQLADNETLQFPTEIYVVGQASTTLIDIGTISIKNQPTITDSSGFYTPAIDGKMVTPSYEIIPYNNLVYLVRAVCNCPQLTAVGGLNCTSGLLIDTYVPATIGNLRLAHAARYKRSGMQFFGDTYTPTTMVDSLDTLDFTSITGEVFLSPTIFIPIPELDAAKGFAANISNFIGQQFWTFVYPEIVAQPGDNVNGVPYPKGFNLDTENKPILSLQKLHFVYDPLAVLFTPNDLTHKYPLQPKQQVLALTNGQVQDGICWRTENPQADGRSAPYNVCAQQELPDGWYMDRPNIIYSRHNRPVQTSTQSSYLGMSVKSIRSVSGTLYNIEESSLSNSLSNDQAGGQLISTVSSVQNMLVTVLFDYDNNDLGDLTSYNADLTNKGAVVLNGYLGGSGYSFSSPDHFDVNDVLPSQVPWLDMVADVFGYEVAFYDIDLSLPRQFWSLSYDNITGPGLPNYIANVPPSIADPYFSNRTRSLLLNFENQVRPQELGAMDTMSSVVSVNLHLQNGVTGSIFMGKKADRDVASLGTNPIGTNSFPLTGLPTKYDFFIFTRDHYYTLHDAQFELVDQGYAMCLLDDGTGTGNKVAKYFVDSDGNYNELYTYVLYSPSSGILETNSFALKVTLGSPANLAATPIAPETPNNVNPQDLVAQINKLSNLVYAVFGPSVPGQPAAFIPIQAVGTAGVTAIAAAPITGQPGFNGYSLNVATTSKQPALISHIFSANVSYPIAGSTTIQPFDTKKKKPIPFYGSLSHGLDAQVFTSTLQSADQTSYIPRTTDQPVSYVSNYGGNGQGSLIGTSFSLAFQGSGAIPPAIAANPSPGTVMKADDSIFYTYNAITNNVMDSTGKPVIAVGGQYFIDITDPENPVYVVISLPTFLYNGITYTVNLSTTLADGITSCYTLIAGGQSFLFGPDNAHVTVDRSVFTFNGIADGVYTVSVSSLDAPAVTDAPSPISLTPFTITGGGLPPGGQAATIDVFNLPINLEAIILGVTGRFYDYDPVHGTVTVTQNGIKTPPVPIKTGLTFASSSSYGYVITFEQGVYSVNGSPMYPYTALSSGNPASYALMTAPQMFTRNGNFYTFDIAASGTYVSVTGNGQTYPVNPYQFSINGETYIINTNVQPNTVVGGGNIIPMTAANSQFILDGVQYTIVLKLGSLSGATISGQFNITQGNVVVIEDFVYLLDTLNGQIVGNGTTYPLTTSGSTYTISTANNSFTVTTETNAETVEIGDVVYQINNSTVVGDGITYPILPYRTFVDEGATFNIGLDGTVMISPTLKVANGTFTDNGLTYTVNQNAAFDGANYYLLAGTALTNFTFTANGLTYQLRTDAVAVTVGSGKTFFVNIGNQNLTSVQFGPKTLDYPPAAGDAVNIAAFDGKQYYAIVKNQFKDSDGNVYTLSGNTAVSDGNSYEIYSNLGQGGYFEVPNGNTYYVNIAVANFGTPSGDIYNVFPIASGSFTIPLLYTLTVSGSEVSVDALTFGAETLVATLQADAGSLTGGNFTDPVTGIVYECIRDGEEIVFVDSNNNVYPLPLGGNTFTALVPVSTAVSVAVDSEAPPNVYPVLNNSFIASGITYTTNLPVAYQNAAGPYLPMVNQRFIVPQAAPQSNLAYRVVGSLASGAVIKSYVVSEDDEFSVNGNVVYTVNEVNVVKATNQATLTGPAASPTVTLEANTYLLDPADSIATLQSIDIAYNTATKQFTVNYPNTTVTYTLGAAAVTDNRKSQGAFSFPPNGNIITFTDTVSGVTFSFDSSGNNPVTVQFFYESQFFIDALNGITYYVDTTDNLVEAISYLPETTRYAFTPADGNTYLIHYNDVEVVFPVIAGANVNAGVATVGSDIFTLEVDEVDPAALAGPSASNGPQVHQTDLNSFEINGELYTITGAPQNGSYVNCQVVGAGMSPFSFTGPNTFKLSDPAVTYTLHLDADGLPETITATFAVQPSLDLISVGDEIYVITYLSVTSGSLLGQGQSSIPIANSSFKLTNPFDTTTATFIFADANIYDAGSVVGQFTVRPIPTFFIANTTFTLDTVNLVVTDNNKRPYPLVTNPQMFSINGFNYLIDTNSVPHAIVGNNNTSPLATDVTVQSGKPFPNSTFTLNGQVYAYIEDSAHNLLTITGTKSYMIAQPELTFKLDSSILFTLAIGPPTANTYPGSVKPIGTVTSGSTVMNVYAGTPESGMADFFTYKNVLYTFVKSGSTYVAVQKSYTVYVSQPAANQQQLAVFDMNGITYIVTDGNTAGVGTAAGINPGSMWSATNFNTTESQLGVVYGLAAQPTNVVFGNNKYQFPATDNNGNTALLDIIYTAGATNNQVVPDTPKLLPSFTQTAAFTFLPSYAPLTFETGGYNAFTSAVEESATPIQTFSAAWNTPILSTDDAIGDLIGPQGDFSVEFWHSIPRTPVSEEHVFTYVGTDPLVSYVDIDFLDSSSVQVTVNDTVMQAGTTPPVFTSGWRHVALTYTQPYVMLCQGAPFTVADGSDFNFERDFTIAMTISVSDTGTEQGLLYKGTGSDIPAPQTQTSFRVTLNTANQVVFEVVGSDNTLNSFTGPALDPGDYYQVLITKHTKTPMGDDTPDSDPYSPPFNTKQLMAPPKGPTQVTVNDGTIAIGTTNTGGPTAFEKFAANITTPPDTGYIMSIAVRKVFTNGTYDNWNSAASPLITTSDAGLMVMSTGASNLLIGGACDDSGLPIPFGTLAQPGSIREVYLFASAIRTAGIRTGQGFVSIDQATDSQLQAVGLVGCWRAAYDPNGIVSNLVNDNAFAASSNGSSAILSPLTGHESEGIALYVNGSPVTLNLQSTTSPSPSGHNALAFNAYTYRIQEISFWNMVRQPYQVIDDMFGQLIPPNEPFLTLYLPGSFPASAPGVGAPLLPMAKFIENVEVANQGSLVIDLGFASLDLQGCPAIGKCGPLISPNLYTPPGIALTVCDTVPDLTTYSVTLNTVTGTLAGEINEAYVFVRNNVLTLYAGKKVGDLSLVWVSQEQGDVQVMGYIEGAPPAPMANLTNKPSYAGATSVSFNAPVSLSYKFQTNNDSSSSKKGSGGASGNFQDAKPTGSTASKVTTPANMTPDTSLNTPTVTDTVTNPETGVTTSTQTSPDGSTATTTTTPQGGGANMSFKMGIGPVLAALGFGIKGEKLTINVDISAGVTVSGGGGTGTSGQQTATEKMDESNKYTVRLEGATTPYTGDTFMASLNSLTTPSTTPGTPASKTPILPNPNLGGFSASNPPGALPKTAPTEERLGQRMFQPSPYGQAFVTSRTLDVYQQILLQTNTTFGFIRVPNTQIPRDINILSFRMSSKYIRPGCLDGMIGYQYNPATLASGAETWLTSTGQLSPLYDGNFSQGEIGHNASYMRVVEAYQIKKQIDQQVFNALALYATAYGGQTALPDDTLTPALDFYNEYVWSSRGGTQEVKHTYSTSYEEVYLTTKTESLDVKVDFNAKFSAAGTQIVGLSGGFDYANNSSNKWAITSSATGSFDVTASFDGIENDTQMRYASNNDAHFLMNFNSTFNPSNQSGVNLVAGSDGLVYQIVPSVTSGAGLPTSDNIDTSFSYQQPQPSYTTGNADGLTGNLEPYDRPGKTNLFRTYSFFLQPSQNNADDFWNTVVDPNWLANSTDPDAIALLSAKGNASLPWRLLYRVTYSERFLPPISTASLLTPQITPVFAVPVTNPVTDFLLQQPGSSTESPLNPYNDVEANIVLVAPTSSGLPIGTIPTSGSSQGLPVLPNNVILFDLVSSLSSIVNWGDTVNTKLLTNLTMSVLAMNTIPMQAFAPAGSTKAKDVLNPAGNIVYSVWSDPNGITIYTAQVPGTIVYQDVNGNPIQYFDGKTYQSLQADYIPTIDGTVTYYIQPPTTYDQTTFSLVGDDDLYGSPGDQWRYYLVSGYSSKMTASSTIKGSGPFMISSGYTGFSVAETMHDPKTGARLVQGYVLVQGMMEWPNLNVTAESFADVQVYKSLSLLDTFPIGDPEVLQAFLTTQYPNAPFVNNDEINLVFAKNITSYFNSIQQLLIPQ